MSSFTTPSPPSSTLHSPLYIVAPMVGCSSPSFRHLCILHSAHYCYTEMYLSTTFATSQNYRLQALGTSIRPEEAGKLIVQFASNTPETFLSASLEAQKLGCAGVDLNLGCPQTRARIGNYGAWMTDDHDLCVSIISSACTSPSLTVPVSVKIRIQEPTPLHSSLERTVEFALRLAAAGAWIIAVHGRRRGGEDKRRDGSADLDVVKAVVTAVREKYPNVVIVANGNVRSPENVLDNLKHTEAGGVMVAEEVLRRFDLFSEVELIRLGGGVREGNTMRRKKERVLEYFKVLELMSCGEQSRVLRLEDGSMYGKNGNMVRGTVGDGEEDFERMSMWWTNVEVVKSHVRWMLADRGELASRNSFKKAKNVGDIIQGVRRRFGVKE